MKFRHAIAGATALTAVAGAAAQPAVAAQQSEHTQASALQSRYEATYHKVVKLGGHPGRDILSDGVRRHGRDVPASPTQVRHSLSTLERMKGQLTAPSASSTSTASSTGASTGGTSLPSCTWQPESGGDYNAVNSSSGARGKYQIMPSTYAAYGGDGSWSQADQDRVAQRIYAATGGSAWVNC
ncbi:MAG TPA: transglycosylase family protein [Solirubrobacteraceae bacterium]